MKLERKVVSGIMLTLLLIGTLTLARINYVHSDDVIKIGIGIYWDYTCVLPVDHIDWGTLNPGDSSNITVYVRNEGDANVTLFFVTDNWSPGAAAYYVSLSWDYSGKVIESEQVANITFTLSIDSDIEEVYSFAFDIVISYTDAPFGFTYIIRATGSILYIRVRARVLFDLLHLEQFRFFRGYSRLSEELSARGYIIYQFGREPWDTGQLSSDILENFDILVLPNPQIVRFGSLEVEAIIDFVQNGGGLLVLGGSYPVSDSNYPVKDIITYFGIGYELPITRLHRFITEISPHPVTRNVTALDMLFVEALSITIPAQSIAFSQGKPVVAVSEYGSGRVVVIAAEHMFVDYLIGSYDNLLLALNAFGWLSELGGGPHPQELPIVKIKSWNPPTSMIVSTDYAINVEIQNIGVTSVPVVVTIPPVPIFDENGWGVGELIGDSKDVYVSPGVMENVSLTVRPSVIGYTFLETYVCAPFHTSFLVFDGKYSNKTPILPLPVFIDINPDALNLRSKGKWITAYLELPEGCNVSDIDVSTLLLNDTIPAELRPVAVGDYDNDTIPDLMVKFDRAEVTAVLSVGEATLTITGKVNGTSFEGTDTIRVIDE